MGSAKMKLFHENLFFVLVIQSTVCAKGIRLEENPCPDKWVQATFVNMGCLLFNATTSYHMEQANVYCQEQNASLVEIQTEEQLEFLQMEISVVDELAGSNIYWWTAATDMGTEGNWIWIRSLTHVSEWIWSPGEPNQGMKNNCMIFYQIGGSYFGVDCPCIYENVYPIC